ncbi:MAG: macro domain-containing protein, partial [Erysipelotrichaceae bacterium]|nr:macro domain-containing protein [Erysipelotrichaceae bacterium]
MPFKIIRNDLTKVKADIIVNTANPYPVAMDGTDIAIYDAAGYDELLLEREKIGYINRGDAAITPAFNLKAKYIIHTVGPVWRGGNFGEEEILKSCYSNSLTKAVELNAKSIAFPLISTGVYGFPKDKALHIAISTISEFLLNHELDVILVVFDHESFKISNQLFHNIQEFIDQNYVDEKAYSEYGTPLFLNRCDLPTDELKEISLDDFIKDSELTFQERLFELIDERNLTDVEVYKRANISRKLFSKIRCNVDFQPNKKTAISLAIALHLTLEEAEDLLDRAGLSLSSSKKFDLIIKYFIIQ